MELTADGFGADLSLCSLRSLWFKKLLFTAENAKSAKRPERMRHLAEPASGEMAADCFMRITSPKSGSRED